MGILIFIPVFNIYHVFGSALIFTVSTFSISNNTNKLRLPLKLPSFWIYDALEKLLLSASQAKNTNDTLKMKKKVLIADK